ncbi:hypothetical protein AK812_SmicGene23807 [Symbiodinium microadriaticum]|uniref:Endonuclease/exonuclease/phosphatase domain-containing protein n=1 Tax=Symbiodinium microadriaticum TaxID=2951 RepID=A0A1Q9DGC5_SYMMI|nr:hypothetical protein AK812_SmicGene23807 [Symbiodinium microadriaticum]
MFSCSPYRRSCHLELLGGFCLLLARAERTALSTELEKVGAERHVELHSTDTTLVLSTEEDLLDMHKVMTQEIDKVRCELDRTINETFTVFYYYTFALGAVGICSTGNCQPEFNCGSYDIVEVCQDLGAVRSLRAAYMNEWSTYLSSVTDLLDQQITEQTQVLANLDEREQQAVDTLLKAKADLARLAAESSQDRDADDMDASEAMVDEAIEFEAQRRDARAAALASTEQLQTTLRGLRQQAVEQAEDARRDGSRTPRRKSKDTAIDLTTEEAKHAAGGDKEGLPYGPVGCALSVDEVHSRTHSFSQCAGDIGDDIYSSCAYLSLGPSILTEATYVSPFMAPFLATQLQFEIALCGLDVPVHSFLADPRIDDSAGPPQYLHSDPQPGVVFSRAVSPLFQEPGVSMGCPPVDPDVGGLPAMAKTSLAQDVAVMVPPNSESAAVKQDIMVHAAPGLSRYHLAGSKEEVCRALASPHSSSSLPSAAAFRALGTHAGPPVLVLPVQDRSFPMMRMHLASRIPVFPTVLDRPEQRQRAITSFSWITGFRATGAVQGTEGQFDRFVIYDSAVHVQIRPLPRGWDLNHVVAELLGIFPRLRSVRFLFRKLPNLPSLQVSVTMRDAPLGQEVLPLDFRHQEGRICTVRVSPGMSPGSVYQVCIRDCPHSRLPRRRFTLHDAFGEPLHIPDEVDDFPDYGRGAFLEQLPMHHPAGALPDHGRDPLQAPDEELRDNAEAPADEVDDHVHLMQGLTGRHRSADHPRWTDLKQPIIERQEVLGSLQGSAAPLSPAKASTSTSAKALTLVADACPQTDILGSDVCGSDPCPVLVPSGDPPTLLRTEGPPRASVVHSTAKVPTILPERLAAPNLREIPAGQLCLFCQTAAHHNELRRYSVFDRNRHHVVRKASAHWSLLDYIVDATSSVAEETQSVQVLTLPIADLPEPQLTITPAGLPPGVLVIPLDARSIGGPLCALPLTPGMDYQRVLDALVRVAPSTLQLIEQALQLDGVFLQDPTGRIWESLPIDLSEVQWLKIFLEPRVQQQLDWLVTMIGPTTLTSTAAMTTPQASNPTETVSFVLAGGGTVIRLAPQLIRVANVRQSLCELLFILGLQGRVPHRPVVSLASAAPRQAAQPANRIVIFLVYPASDIGEICHILQDYSLDGSLLQEMSVDCDVVAGHLISEAHRRRGYLASLNGIPHTASGRTLITGDLIQVEQAPPSARVTPIDALFDILPDLRFFSMPLRVPSLVQLMRDPAAGLVRQDVIKDAMLRTLDHRILERRVEVGEPGHNCQAILVLGPEHPPLLLYMPSNVAPSLAEATTFLAWSGFFEPGTTFVDPHVFAHTFPVFVSVPKGSQRATVLFPAPHTLLRWLQLSVPLGTPLQGFGLPVRRNFELVLPASTTHGAVIRERLIGGHASSSDPEGVSLLQVRMPLSLSVRPDEHVVSHPHRESKQATEVKTIPQDWRRSADTASSASLLQVSTQLRQVRIPTPSGRRVITVPTHTSQPQVELKQAVPEPNASTSGVAAHFGPRHAEPETLAEHSAGRHGPRILSLESLLPSCQPAVPESALQFPLPADIEEHAFDVFDLRDLSVDVPLGTPLVPAASSFLSALPRSASLAAPEALMLFVDGSYRGGCSAWAVVVLGRHQQLWSWLGYRSGRLLPQVCPGPCYDGEEQRQADARTVPVRTLLLTYNTLSCKANLQRHCLQQFMQSKGAAILALQETRHDAPPLTVTGGTIRVASAPLDGQLGCQLWLRATAPLTFDRHRLAIVCSEPRLLIVLAHTQICRFALIVAHAPTSTTPDAERNLWWDHLDARLAGLPPAATPVICCDANARFRRQGGCEVPSNANAERLQALLAKYQLCRTRSFAPDGALYTTWRSPQGCPACLDYILVPQAWEAGLTTVSNLGLLDMHSGIDHDVLGADLRLDLPVPSRRGNGIDRDSMLTPQGRLAIANLFASAPLCPWAVSSDDHLQQLHAHLLQGARTLFPRRPSGPRRPVLSQQTWHLLHLRRWARRVFRRRRQLFLRERLWLLFRGWRSLCAPGLALCDAGSATKEHDYRVAQYIRFMQQLTVSMRALPSAVDLASAFAGMKCGKAPGPTLLPPELFKAAPLEAALQVMPILLKSQARQCYPLLWRGVHSIALLKPNKPPHKVESHRAIALMPTTGKAVAKACRPTLAAQFETITLPSVGGSRKAVPIELPSLLVQTYLNFLDDAGLNGGVLFLDGVAAFPSTDRSLLFSMSDEELRAKLEASEVEPQVVEHFRRALQGKGALARAGVPDDMIHFLRTALRGTWYSVDSQSSTAYATTCGTLPGAPNADLAFQYAAQASLVALSAHLAEEGLSACLVTSSGPPVQAQPATWLDDLALLVSSPDAQMLPSRVARATSLAVQYLRLLGVDTNFAAGKTEAVLHVCGRGSQQVRHDCAFGDTQGSLPGIKVHAPGSSQVQLRCVSRYAHLGTLRAVNADVAGDIKRRLGLAREALKPVRARLLCNPNFSVAEKRNFVFSLVLSRLMHNAGTWVFRFGGDQATYRRGYVSLLRACVRPLCGFPCRRLTDEQVCALVGAMLPREALACARVRVLAAVTAKGHDFLRVLLLRERRWWEHVVEDVQLIASVLRDSQLVQWSNRAHRATEFLPWILPAQATANLLRRFRRAATDSRSDLAVAAARKAQAHAAAAQAGVDFIVLDAALDEAAAAEAQKLQDDAQRFLERTHSALFLLQVKEWRLQVAVRHGVFGRCCCQTDSVSNCEWVDRWLLVGHDLQCPARLGTDYLDHYTGRQQQMALNELMPDDVAPLDTLIDACRASSQWRQHVKGRQDRLVEAVPADALKAVKDLAVWPAVDMKQRLVEQIEP